MRGRKGLFQITALTHFITEGHQAETEVETVEESCLLACSVSFLIYPRTTCPEMGPPTMAWVLPTSVIYQENALQTRLLVNVMKIFSQSIFNFIYSKYIMYTFIIY